MLRHRSPYLRSRCLSSARAALVLLAVGLVATAPSATAQTGPAPTSTQAITLRDVLDSALARHPLAEAARVRVRAARGARTTARAFGNPVLSYDVENAPFPGGSSASGVERETMTTAMIPLESILRRAPRARQANAQVRAAEADASAARQHLALDASRAFFRTALAQVSIAVARDLTAWLDSVVAYNRIRVEEGVAAEADLIRAELERDRASAQLTLHEAEYARMRAELAAFVGNLNSGVPNFVVTVDDTPIRLPIFADTPSARTQDQQSGRLQLERVDLTRRPDVRAARERLEAAGAGISTERSMIVRELAATFGAKRSVGTTSMIAGVSMALPIFDPNRGEIVRASAERDAAQFELAARERTARAEMAGAYDAARLLTERASLLARGAGGRPSLLTRAGDARRIALGAYREGAVPLLQVIDAARAWGDARLTFYETLYAQHESVASLLVAHGDDLFTELPSLAARGQGTQR